MTFWEFGCAVAGYVEAHGGGDKPEVIYPTSEEFEEALRSIH